MSAEAATLEAAEAAPARAPSRVGRWARRAWGTFTGVVLLAVVAAVPGLNLLVFGYLLEAQGRLARGARLSEAFAGAQALPRLGGALLLTWLWILPVRLLAGFAADAELISPGHAGALSAVRWTVAVLVGAHLVRGWAKGGRPLDLLLPWRFPLPAGEGGPTGRVRGRSPSHTVFPASPFPLRRIAWLGAVGFFGSLAWLFVPVMLLILARAGEGHPPLGVVGGLLLAPVLVLLPLLQVRLAETGRWRSLLEWRAARAVAGAAPVATSAALLLLYLLTLPLYLLKVALPPSDAMWVVTLVFIITVVPVRILVAKAYGRGLRRGARAGWAWRWLPRLVLVPVLLAYAALLFLTPLIDSHGPAGLFAQHALLLPVPF